jgi:peptidoglycan LD-endopeptidase LytH
VATLEWKRTARTFGIGALCGFVIGAALVAVLITRYGLPRAVPMTVPTGAVSNDDGLADVDAPILEGRPLTGVMPGTPTATGGESSTATTAAAEALTNREFDMPVEGVKPEQLVRSFEERRSGSRSHEAIDILAPRNTPVKAVDDGKIARLFESKAGGLTIYQFDPTEQFCYYYAHLEGYAPGLKEGDAVERGQVIGYVGTSGNAPRNTPHLHFAVFKLTAAKRWWEGTPIDPYDILR